MKEENSTNQIENCTQETENQTQEGENCTNENVVQPELTLREKVFLACDNMRQENKKISRSKVRERTKKGSNRDLSRYINEWYESRGIKIEGEQENEDALVTVPNSEVQNQPRTVQVKNSNYNEQPKNDISDKAREIAEKAAAMILAEELGTQFLLENPDKLPEDLKQMVKEAREANARKRVTRSAQYDPKFFAESVIAQFG